MMSIGLAFNALGFLAGPRPNLKNNQNFIHKSSNETESLKKKMLESHSLKVKKVKTPSLKKDVPRIENHSILAAFREFEIPRNLKI